MRKTMIQCVGNVILFTLLGLAFIFPTSEVTKIEMGLSANLTIFPVLLVTYLIAYPVIYYIISKKYQWGKRDISELTYTDEREKIIVAESTKTAYKVLVGGLLIIIAVIGGVNFLSLFTGIATNLYSISITLLTLLLNIAMISYCVKWCLEYKK